MADPSVMPKRISFTKTWHTKPYPYISPTRPELSADGKNVVITGGGTGIGNAIGIAFAQAGAKSVSILGRRLEKLESGAANISAVSKKTQVLYEVADLLNRSQVDIAFKAIVEKVGKVDILVSNAAYIVTPGSIVDCSPDILLRGFEVNVMGALNAAQAFMLVSGSDPVLLNTSTCLAHMSPWSGVGPYAITKAANLKMMDSLAIDNPDVHIVNVQPGWVATDMNGHQKEAPDVGKLSIFAARTERFLLVHANVFPAELPGQFFVWLASSEARFLKGKFVWANWDVEELLERADEIKSTKLLNWVLDGVPM